VRANLHWALIISLNIFHKEARKLAYQYVSDTFDQLVERLPLWFTKNLKNLTALILRLPS
jgi:hypothetical protein